MYDGSKTILFDAINSCFLTSIDTKHTYLTSNCTYQTVNQILDVIVHLTDALYFIEYYSLSQQLRFKSNHCLSYDLLKSYYYQHCTNRKT